MITVLHTDVVINFYGEEVYKKFILGYGASNNKFSLIIIRSPVGFPWADPNNSIRALTSCLPVLCLMGNGNWWTDCIDNENKRSLMQPILRYLVSRLQPYPAYTNMWRIGLE